MHNFAARICGGLVVTSSFAALAGAPQAAAQTVVTTYVTRVQEERESTRWTLTEWLRIKERMRMMDLWLAMFSDPKKDKFRPEFNVSYGSLQGSYALTDEQGKRTAAAASGTQGRVQLWLTNILTGTVGVRALNIDLGGEGYQRGSGELTLSKADAATGATDGAATGTLAAATDGTVSAETPRSFKHTYYAGNLRVFGNNIQDTSIVLKYGRYSSVNSVPSWDDVTQATKPLTGAMAGAEVQLYLTKFLGLEGNYIAYGDADGPAGSDLQHGSYAEGMGFVEVSLVRLMVGRYREDWVLDNAGKTVNTTETGVIGGAKLQF